MRFPTCRILSAITGMLLRVRGDLGSLQCAGSPLVDSPLAVPSLLFVLCKVEWIGHSHVMDLKTRAQESEAEMASNTGSPSGPRPSPSNCPSCSHWELQKVVMDQLWMQNPETIVTEAQEGLWMTVQICPRLEFELCPRPSEKKKKHFSSPLGIRSFSTESYDWCSKNYRL